LNFKILKCYIYSGLNSVLADRALYITDFMFGTLTPFLIHFFLWTAIYSTSAGATEDSRIISGFAYHDTLYYFAFTLLISRLNNGFDIIAHLSSQILEGKLDTFLVKPISYPVQRLSVHLGENILYIIPVLVLFLISIYFNYASVSIGYLVGIVVLLVLSQLLSFFLSFSLALITFWVIDSGIILSAVLILSTLFGGVLLPPEFWPDWLVPIMKYNPFRYMIAAPAEFFVKPTFFLWAETVLMSSFYIGVFAIIINKFWRCGLKRYVGIGG